MGMTDLDRLAISAMRRSYGAKGLNEADLPPDPLPQFHQWLSEAVANHFVIEANAMVLSTCGQDQPTSRTVLLKDFTTVGFTFFTNYESKKAKEIAQNPKVSLLFPWYAMERQVIVMGIVTTLSHEENEAYFSSRPWNSQIGAWASAQSEELSSREELENNFQKFADKYPDGSPVPTPDHWGGYVVQPTSVEFWQGRYSRLHDRIRFIKGPQNDNGWEVKRFYP
jgi:pyridoxamine 5'-phosphate oxidase